jgi:thioredoxin 1
MSNKLDITGTELNNLITSGVTVVDFWAPWCGPCKVLGPVIEEIAEELQNKVKVVKLNVDNHEATSDQYAVRSIPTIIIFKDGKEVERMVGVSSKQTILAKINNIL